MVSGRQRATFHWQRLGINLAHNSGGQVGKVVSQVFI